MTEIDYFKIKILQLNIYFLDFTWDSQGIGTRIKLKARNVSVKDKVHSSEV